jgi:L-ascorbate metabolism protein UlaG (beta-lactamase superfamily)
VPEVITAQSFPKHFDGKRFYNPDAPQARGWLDALRWKLTSRPEPSPPFFSGTEQSTPAPRIEGTRLRVTFVNHSTVLLQQNGSNILTDPIWSERASPFRSIGPRRRRMPGVRREDLPPIDIVLITHNHYDHLDIETLRWLRSARNSIFVVPIGVRRLLRSEKIEPVHEMDWGDAQTFGTTTIYSVPAFHFSARGVFDRNKTLWCGYVIESQGRTVYFAGDTAFGDHFSQIQVRFGSPRLAFLPIGAYEPRWFMSPVHMAPEEAIRAHEILGATTSIAIHHGTFQLGDDAVDTAKRVLIASPKPDSFLILENGESTTII